MPDISMCANCECPFRKICYRYLAEPTEDYQSYADFKPEIIRITGGVALQCKNFWNITGRKVVAFKEAEERNKKLYDNWNKRRKNERLKRKS